MHFISAKTVVGDAIHVGDTIILPLVDVSFGVGAGAFEGDKKSNGGGGMTGKLTPSAVLGNPEWNYQTRQCQESGRTHQSPRYGSGFCRQICLWIRQE